MRLPKAGQDISEDRHKEAACRSRGSAPEDTAWQSPRGADHGIWRV